MINYFEVGQECIYYACIEKKGSGSPLNLQSIFVKRK